jgi:hypothetical protein
MQNSNMLLKVVGIALAVVIFTAIAPFFGAHLPDTATSRGVALILTGRIGLAIPIVGFGAVGLFYKPNPILGYVLGCIFVGVLMFIGAMPN